MATGREFGEFMAEQALAFAKWKAEENALAFFEDREAAPADVDFERWMDEMLAQREREDADAAWLDLYNRQLHPVTAQEEAFWTGQTAEADAEMPHALSLAATA